MAKKTAGARGAGKALAARPRRGPGRPAAAAGGGAGADDLPPVLLPETLDVAAAAPLARALLARRGRPTVVDAAAASRPGAQCLQVLVAAIKTWERDGAPFTFVNCGAPFLEHVEFLGLDRAPFLKGVQS